MKRRTLVLVASLLIALLVWQPVRVSADDYEDDEDDMAETEDAGGEAVLTLGSGNFSEIVDGAQYALVEFYAPWCGHCKSLAPEYEKAAAALKTISPDVVLAKVDATVDADLAKEFGVSGYPTLKFFVGGKSGAVSDYNGGRTQETIISWIKKKTGPPAATLTSVEALEHAKTTDGVLMVAYFDKLEGSDFDTFTEVARKMDDIAFYQTTDSDVAGSIGIKSAPGYAVGLGTDDGFTSAISKGHSAFANKTASDAEKLEAFIKAEKLPAYLEFAKETQGKIFNSGIPKQILLIGSPKQLYDDKSTVEAIKAAHDKYKGQVVFVTANTAESITDNVLKFFGASSDAPAVQVIGFAMAEGKKYAMEDKLTPSSLTKFAGDFLAGKLKPLFKSDEIPKNPTDNGVHIVVGKNFDEVVLDDKRDVFLEVYAPWCGHCKSLAPTWEKLAKRFKKVDSVVIAKMDGTTNEHEKVQAQGFPTLMFFPAGQDTAIPYNGGRDLKDLTKFVKETAAIQFELPKKKKGDKEEL
jgi:protein disulfide-isomerase A1